MAKVEGLGVGEAVAPLRGVTAKTPKSGEAGVLLPRAATRNMEIFMGRLYQIVDEGLIDTPRGKSVDEPVALGRLKALKDGTISFIMDCSPMPLNDVEILSQDARFLEEAHFVVRNRYEKDKQIAEFDGTLIDAIKYASENLVRLQREAGDRR